MFLSILTFDFDSILGSFLTFWGPNGLFFGLGKSPNTVLGSTHLVEQLLLSIVPSILTLDFDLILGLFLTFWGPNGLFLGSMGRSKTVLGYTRRRGMRLGEKRQREGKLRKGRSYFLVFLLLCMKYF